MLNITTNFPAIQRQLETLRKEVASRAMARALNRTVEQARTQMVRGITSEFNIRAGEVRDRLRIRKAFAGGVSTLEAVLSASGGRKSGVMNVINFGARQTRSGIVVKIKRASGRTTLQDAFIGNKGRTVFVRIPGTKMRSRSRYRGTHAEQIRGFTTVDVPRMFNTTRINQAVRRAVLERFPNNFAREVRFELRRFGA